MKIEEIESVMSGLGFSLYESRAYAALVAEHPLTGYELSGRSGIPRSKIYECIERLLRKGLLVALDGTPVRYAPVPPEELVRRLSSEFSSSLDRLGKLLEEEPRTGDVEYVFNIGGYDRIIAKADDMTASAKSSLDLAVWGEELGLVREGLEKAALRGVRVRILAFDGGDAPSCEVYRHRALAPGEFSGRWIAVVRDRREVLTGQCSGGGEIVAAWTKNPCLVFMSLKYIEHEIIRIRERGER